MDARLNLDFKTHKWLAEHVSHQGEACLAWPYSKNRGYGNLKWDGKIEYAHRVMCELAHGAAPSPAHEVAHSCGNGHLGCVHPGHLSWKTRAENQLDRREHGTSGNGGYGRRSRLTPEQVLAIQASDEQNSVLAERHGVTRSAIRKIKIGEIWQQIHGTPDRAKVVEALTAAGRPLHRTEMPVTDAVLCKMVKRGKLVRVSRGHYALPAGNAEEPK